MKRGFLLILVLLIFSGCSTPTVYISSLTDPNYTPLKTDPIYLGSTDDPSMKDRQFYPFLKNEMISNGFNIVEELAVAKYYIVFTTDSDTSEIKSEYAETTYYGSTSTTIIVPYRYDYTVEKIYLFLYAVEDAKNGKHMTVWEGYAGAGEEEYLAYTRAILKSLFDVFGTNYKAHTPIDTNFGK